MLKKLLDQVYVEGVDQHLLNALNALTKDEREEAAMEIAAYLVAEKALNGPLNYISHPEDIRGENVQITKEGITGEVYYRGKTHKIEVK